MPQNVPCHACHAPRGRACGGGRSAAAALQPRRCVAAGLWCPPPHWPWRFVLHQEARGGHPGTSEVQGKLHAVAFLLYVFRFELSSGPGTTSCYCAKGTFGWVREVRASCLVAAHSVVGWPCPAPQALPVATHHPQILQSSHETPKGLTFNKPRCTPPHDNQDSLYDHRAHHYAAKQQMSRGAGKAKTTESLVHVLRGSNPAGIRGWRLQQNSCPPVRVPRGGGGWLCSYHSILHGTQSVLHPKCWVLLVPSPNFADSLGPSPTRGGGGGW